MLVFLVLGAFSFLPQNRAKAFDLFSNCPTITNSDGTKSQVCACKNNSSSVACKQAQGQNTLNPISGPKGIINTAANVIALIAAVGAMIMILIGGFFYITAAGNAEQIAAARKRVINAVLGLVIISLAWAIVRLITDNVIQ